MVTASVSPLVAKSPFHNRMTKYFVAFDLSSATILPRVASLSLGDTRRCAATSTALTDRLYAVSGRDGLHRLQPKRH
jgi:hypothetical protein